jgi:acyl carrier protein
MNIEQTLTEFIEAKLIFDKVPAKIERDDALFGGLLDSLDILRLVSFIEDRFHIRVADNELVPENFHSVLRLGEYVRQKSRLSA